MFVWNRRHPLCPSIASLVIPLAGHKVKGAETEMKWQIYFAGCLAGKSDLRCHNHM